MGSLLDISFDEQNGKMIWSGKHNRIQNDSLKQNFNKFFEMADEILLNLRQYLPEQDDFKQEENIHDEHRWYWLPSELYHDVIAFCDSLNKY